MNNDQKNGTRPPESFQGEAEEFDIIYKTNLPKRGITLGHAIH